MSIKKLFLLIFLSAVMGGTVAVVGLNYLIFTNIANDSPSANQTAANLEPDSTIPTAQPVDNNIRLEYPQVDTEEKIVQSIYQDVSPAVVHITTVRYAYNFWRGDLIPQKGTGSGVVVDSKGYILTNFHVIRNALTSRGELYVTFSNGESEEATVVGYDEISDMAVIKLKEEPHESLPVASLGDSDKLKVGSRAVAIGNPFGLSGTCTVGFISALNRTIKINNQELEGMIQTDATINPGNSGGPLINSYGEVIGINSAIFSQSGGSEGIGFAIPINIARQVMNDLIQYGKVRRPYLGVETFPVVSTLASYLNLPVTEGLLIQRVEPGSPAYKAGLKGGDSAVAFRQFRIFIGGDIIVAVNGEKITTPMEFQKIIRKMEIGDKVTLAIYRGDKKMKVEIELELQE
ncbi:trypsin-like peptidase domain-containing protein [bacterium]|nr:trypsin-like peptidase domain-containing protein [bacterium]